jgi:hypothetical protein
MKVKRRSEATFIPDKIAILLSGIPATRKSTFGRYLARNHGFAHYDLERHPRGWPKPELKELWERDTAAFIAQLLRYHDRIALDWGFPACCLPMVKELQALGVRLIWFGGDVDCASPAGLLDYRALRCRWPAGGCKWYHTLSGPASLDWGVCGNPASHRAGFLTFEHQGCPEFEQE